MAPRKFLFTGLLAAMLLPSEPGAESAGARVELPLASIMTAEGTLDLTPFRGRVVYLDFWASWCRPCTRSFRWMSLMHERYADRGLVIVAVNLDRDRASAEQFIARARPRFAVVLDSDARLARSLDIDAMPSSFLFDARGRPVASQSGFRDDDARRIEREIDTLVRGAAPYREEATR